MNSFAQLASQLSTMTSRSDMKYVSKRDYEQFCKEYIFAQLCNESFGSAFCERFAITDFVLAVLVSVDSAKKHINTIGYIK